MEQFESMTAMSQYSTAARYTLTVQPRRDIPHRISHQNATVISANPSEASRGSAIQEVNKWL
jgi:hypothetical protein